jgi:hypothetical protein
MRYVLWVLAFTLTFALGAALIRAHTYFTEWRSPAFSEAEASAMVGRRVRNTFWADNYRGMKCPERGGRCEDVHVGDEGTVVGIEPSSGGYFLIVRWDQQATDNPMLSYFGRMTRRVFLQVQ